MQLSSDRTELCDCPHKHEEVDTVHFPSLGLDRLHILFYSQNKMATENQYNSPSLPGPPINMDIF